MFYYKSGKVRTPFFRAAVPVGAEYEDEAVVLTMGEEMLSFSLFSGERSVVACREIGQEKKTGNMLYAEISVAYGYDIHSNTLFLCCNEYEGAEKKENGCLVSHPVLRLFRKQETDSDVNRLEMEVLLEVSAGASCLKAAKTGLGTALVNSVNQIYETVKDQALNSGIAVSSPLKAAEPGMVGGWVIDARTIPANTVFFNVVGSTGDPMPTVWDKRTYGDGWLGYYSEQIGRTDTHYCASKDTDYISKCSKSQNYVGGHILLPLIPTGDKNQTGSVAHHAILGGSFTPVKGGSYQMLPICCWHNNWHRADILMQTYQRETVLFLDGFQEEPKRRIDV